MTGIGHNSAPGFVAVSMPPSANHLWRHTKAGSYKTQRYNTWLRAWAGIRHELGRIDGPYRVVIRMGKPKRARDLDNSIKPINDLLQHAGVVENDSACREVIARWDATAPDETVLIGVFHWRELEQIG